MLRGTEGSNPFSSSGESSANLRRVPSWLGIFAFGRSRGRVNGELSAQATQFLKPCGGEPPSRIDRQPFSLANRVVHGVVITMRCNRPVVPAPRPAGGDQTLSYSAEMSLLV